MADSSDAAASAAQQAALLAIVKTNILSPVAIGVFFSCMVCGVCLAMSATYFSRFPKDRLWMKVLVAVLTVSAIIDTGNNSSWLYQGAVSHFGEVAWNVAWKTQFTIYLFQTGFVIFICQCFFLWRCWIVSQRKATAAVALGGLAAATGLGFEWYSGVWVSQNATLLSDFGKIRMESWAFCGTQLVSDVVATSVLCWYLIWKPRHDKVAATVTSSPLMRIVTLSFATNSIALILQVLVMGLIGYSLKQGSLASKVYGASVVAALNSRHTTGDHEELEASSYALSGRSKGFGARPNPGTSVHVHVEVEREVDRATDAFGSQTVSPYSVTFAKGTDDGVSLEEKGGVKGGY